MNIEYEEKIVENFKKKLRVLAVIVLFIFVLIGCNYQLIDLQYTFNYAYISLPNGECVEGSISSWTDYDDGDQIQVEIDGVVYLTDTTRCVLVYKKEE